MIDVVALVTARGGSKGLPGKHTRLLGGKQLIGWTIDAALASDSLDAVYVSTDDEGIAVAAKSFGATLPFLRPASLANDDTPHILVIDHFLEWFGAKFGYVPEYLMLLQPTSPLRTASDIDNAVELCSAENAVAVVSVCGAKPHPAKTFRLLDSGVLHAFVPANIAYQRRQDLPQAFAANGAIYINSCASLMNERTFIPEGAIPYVMPEERSVDIDTEWDLLVADAALKALQK